MSVPPYAELAPGIVSVRAFEPAEASAIVADAANSQLWCDAVVNADLDVDPSVRDAQCLYEPFHQPYARVYRDRIESTIARLAAVADKPATLAGALEKPATLAELHVVCYGPGGRYVDHRDTPLEGGTPRVLSMICYLNDDFTGGATTFPEIDLAVKPVAGMAIVFPPTLLHRAEPVVAGEKFVITAWYHAL
jgi:hypothetical protein